MPQVNMALKIFNGSTMGTFYWPMQPASHPDLSYMHHKFLVTELQTYLELRELLIQSEAYVQ